MERIVHKTYDTVKRLLSGHEKGEGDRSNSHPPLCVQPLERRATRYTNSLALRAIQPVIALWSTSFLSLLCR